MTGIPLEAFGFYQRLAHDNTRESWQAHKDEYERDVRAPIEALAAALEDDYAPAHVYRPYRDVRFSKDKRPIKDHQGCIFGTIEGLGWYVSVQADGLMVAGGWFRSRPEQVARYRKHVLEAGGTKLHSALSGIDGRRFDLGGDALKTRPRGVSADHPDLDLLRYRTLRAMRIWEPAKWMSTARLESRIREEFDALRPLVTALADVVGPWEQG